jgi:hypothetical protein
MKKILMALGLTFSTIAAQGEKSQSVPSAGAIREDVDHGLRSPRMAVLGHGAYHTGANKFGYYYTDTTGPLSKVVTVKPEREVSAVGGGLNLLGTFPFAKILYGGFELGLSILSVNKYTKPAYNDPSQIQGVLYGDGILGAAITESIGLYLGAGIQFSRITPLSVNGSKNDPSFSTNNLLGVNAMVGLHILLGKVLINPSVMLDLAQFGVAESNPIFQADPSGITKNGDIITARLAIGYAFR